jgi:hypothetical protein
MTFWPPTPKDRTEREVLRGVWRRERRAYRRYLAFILGLAMAGIGGFALLYFLGGTWKSVFILVGVFGVALVHDTILRHFCIVVRHFEKKDSEAESEQV